MFVITENPIDPEEARIDLRDESCGAIVTFQGRVRDHNEGQSVTALEYEAYRSLAVTEGRAILNQLLEEFDVRLVQSYHRIGRLDLGELAFWFGVAAPHRRAGFKACEAGVDRIKDRVPIWKKEYYETGDSVWINEPTDTPSD